MSWAKVPDLEAFNLFRDAVFQALAQQGFEGPPTPPPNASIVDWLEDLRLRAPMLCGSWLAQDLRVFLDCFLLGVDVAGGDTSVDRRRITQAAERVASVADPEGWDVLLDQQSNQGAASFAATLDELVREELVSGTLPTTSTRS